MPKWKINVGNMIVYRPKDKRPTAEELQEVGEKALREFRLNQTYTFSTGRTIVCVDLKKNKGEITRIFEVKMRKNKPTSQVEVV